MKEKPNYYAILSAEVRYDNRLKANTKLMYAEITALCDMNSECFASNSYFANLYGKSKTSISNWISELVKYKYISLRFTYKEGTKEIDNRYIKIIKGGIEENLNTPYKKTVKSNTTSNNNTNNNINISNRKNDFVFEVLYGSAKELLLSSKSIRFWPKRKGASQPASQPAASQPGAT